MVPKSRSDPFRDRALVCDSRAKETADAAARREWQELAMEWHALASLSSQEESELEE